MTGLVIFDSTSDLDAITACPLARNNLSANSIMADNLYSRGWKGYAATGFFITMSLIALKEMRLSDVAMSVSKPMEDVTTTLKFPDHDQTLRTKYTGIPSLDYGLGFLVAAFLPGASGWNSNALVQQIYFLVSFFPIISISSVEAGRKGNASSVIKWYAKLYLSGQRNVAKCS